MREVAYSLLEQPSGGVSGVPRVVSVISSILQRLVTHNDIAGAAEDPQKLTVFHGLRAPSIGVDKYLERIFKYGNCSPSCFVVAYAYIDRFIAHYSAVSLTSLNVHRLLITSIMVAAKFMEDAYYNNAYYAKVGGISTVEMNRLELEFLFRVGFRLQVTVSAFENYCLHLQREMVLSHGFQVERPIIQYVWNFGANPNPNLNPNPNTLQDNKKLAQQQHDPQQHMQRVTKALWQSYAGV
uniref:Cyclin n=1 Tax=Araucaria cunninghamii TaxID=56994 RepID=A0A0D6R3S0_ARACU